MYVNPQVLVIYFSLDQPQAAKEGYVPDSYVTSDLVPNARPSPAMIYMNMINLDIWSPKSVVKVKVCEIALAFFSFGFFRLTTRPAESKLASMLVVGQSESQKL